MTVSHGQRVAVVALVAALIAVPAASVAATAQQPAQTGVDSCTTIDKSGTYVLTSDVGSNASGDACLTITASDVTLRGNGHTVESAGGTAGTGVLVAGQDVVVSDVTATGWARGVELVDAFGASVESSTLSGNRYGVFVRRTSDATVSNSAVTGNGVGVAAEGSGVELSNVDATGNAMGVEGYHADVTVSRSTVSSNDNLGIRVDTGSLIVDRSVVQNNGNHGIRVVSPDSAKVQYTIISGNGGHGISAEGGRVDARSNWWGTESGPSGAVKDPVTGRLADGSGDSVSEGPNAGVSNVRFDPYYVTDPREGDGQLVGEQQTTDQPTATRTTTAPTTGGAGDATATDTATAEQSTATDTSASTATATDGATTTAAPQTTAGTATGDAGTNGTTAPAAGPGAPLNDTNTTTGESESRTAQVIGGTETSGGTGPGFGVLAALAALGACALLARRR